MTKNTTITDAHPHAWVTGATNQIGQFLLPRLQATGFLITAFSRQQHVNTNDIRWQSLDLSVSLDILHLSDESPQVLFHLAPLPLLPSLLTHLATRIPFKHIVAIGSTSCFTKANSPDRKERRIARQLRDAEMAIMAIAQQYNLTWTLLRPTLVYGCGQDKNITFIARFIHRFGFFPLVGQGAGLRQPVHADDIALACLQAYATPKAHNQAYNLSGGQTLSYRDMVETIFRYLGKQPRILPIPLPIFQFTTRCFNRLPAFSHLSTAMIARMNQDLCFDHTAAQRDFGYQPRRFNFNYK